MKNILLFIAIISHSVSALAIHPVHVSVTNIEIDTAEQNIEYSIRIFADDITNAINNLYNKDIVLDDGISDIEKETVSDYVNDLFQVFINGLKCLPECQRIESLDNSLWFYFNIVMPDKTISSLKIINKLLMDVYPDQTNLMIITINDKQAGYTFNYLNLEANIIIKESEISIN